MRRRECLKTGGLLLGAALSGCWRSRAESAFHAQVCATSDAIAGIPHYDHIADALQAASTHPAAPFRIRIGAGTWTEKLVIERADIQLIGSGRGRTRLRFDAAAGHIAPNGKPWGTWGSATLIVRAPGFVARDLTIENGFDYLEHLRRPELEQIGSNGAQAVALMLDAGADRSLLDGVELIGHQDTLFVDAGLSLFRDCAISGSVDFVFGAGVAVFEHCTLKSRFRPGKDRQGYIAAPSTRADSPYGLCFIGCALTRDPEIPDGSVALGRAWRPTRTFADGSYGDPDVLGAAVYRDCTMDAHIAREGWDAMAYTARDGTRVMLEPGGARFAESGSRGPGAHADARRRQLDASEALRFTTARILAPWSPPA